MGRELVSLRKDVPIEDFQDLLKKQNAEVSRIEEFLKSQGFVSLMNKNAKKTREVSVETSEVSETSELSIEGCEAGSPSCELTCSFRICT